MIAEMAKIQIAAPLKDRAALLEFLQEEEVVHIQPAQETIASAAESDTAYQLAQLQFALEFLARMRKELGEEPKRSLKNMFVTKPAADLATLEKTAERLQLRQLLQDIRTISDTLVQISADIKNIKELIAQVEPWLPLALTGRDLQRTAPVRHHLITINVRAEGEERISEFLSHVSTGIWQEVKREQNGKAVRLLGELVAHTNDSKKVDEFFQQIDAKTVELHLKEDESVTDRYNFLKNELHIRQTEYQHEIEKTRRLLTQENDLKFAYDALLHRQERENIEQQTVTSEYSFVITGWLPAKWFVRFSKRLEKRFATSIVERISIDENDKPPVHFQNKPFIRPFETVTNIYGKPGYNELDPSGALAIFFLIGFGLALTDAGYGFIMVIATWAALKFFRLKRDMRNMAQLLMYAGVATIILGALAGGWFGVVLEDMPEGALKNILLSMKVIDPVADPIALLMVAFALGILQLTFAWVVRAYHNWKTNQKSKIFLDDLPWITIILLILAWVGAQRGILPIDLTETFKTLLLINVGILVLTQGRQHKNIFLKLGSGLISLYGLVSFMSDMLSYSRLLALGLATGIIGLVVNLMAGMAADSVPVVGVVLAAIVLVVGHVFNLGINALGAFIHSGRLQFVEFFPKFMEGGGVAYRPFGRVSKYVDNPKEFT